MTARDTNGNVIQIGTIATQAGEELGSGNLTSTPSPSHNKGYWIAARADTYIRKFGTQALADAATVAATGANVGQLIPSGTILPIYLNKGELIKVDAAGDLVITPW